MTLLTPATKEVVANVALGSTWVSRKLRQFSRTGINRNTPGDMVHVVSVKHAPYLVLIGVSVPYPPYGLNKSLQITNK